MQKPRNKNPDRKWKTMLIPMPVSLSNVKIAKIDSTTELARVANRLDFTWKFTS
jgi:hypothetical protein